LKIIADENIPYVKEVFSHLGEVQCYPGRKMSREIVADAEILLVRSVTQVNEKLLQGTSVRFVGTATIGTDHVDEEYLQKRGIKFTSAAGSNSNSVAEYVSTALLMLAEKYAWRLEDKTIGIIGVGNVGSKVAQKAQALGLKVLGNDPPLQREGQGEGFVSLEEVLAEADIVTCHVPLTYSGQDATYHMINQRVLEQMREGTAFFNTARGAVVDSKALKNTMQKKAIGPVVLDVWENEPNIDAEILEAADIGTPHIAGYSLDGKVNGTLMLHEALCEYLKKSDAVQIASLLPQPTVPAIILNPADGAEQKLLLQAFRSIYDITADDAALRKIIDLPENERGRYFDELRKNYPVRREAFNTRVKIQPDDIALRQKLGKLGFQMNR